jgi:ABC-2 type transport system permease protein
MNNILLISGNIIKRAFKNKKELAILLLLPVAAIFITLLYSSSEKAQNISAGVVNLDKGIYGEKLKGFVKGLPNIKLVNVNNDNYISALKSSKINIAVVIPENFTDNLKSQQFASIYFESKSKIPVYENVKQEINRFISILYTSSQLSKEIAPDSNKENEVIDSFVYGSLTSNLSLDYKIINSKDDSTKVQSLLSAIGFSIMFIMVLVFTTIGTIMEDKKKLTLARIFTFKVREWEIVAGNLIGSLALGMLQLIPVTIVIKYLFDIKWGIQIFSIFIVLLCFVITTIGLGIGISGIIKNNFHPSLIIATVIFPTSLLGGCLIPESMLPSVIGKIGYAVPQKWVMKAIYEILAGGNYNSVLLYIGIILMFAIAFATFGVKTLKPLSD